MDADGIDVPPHDRSLAYEGHAGPLADDRSMSVIGALLPIAL
jgi:hypothetical protein